MTRPGAARVAIILLNHNGLQLTRDCLRSLLAIDYPDYRVFVIDNGSARDESVPLTAEFGDSIDIRRNQEALGFCVGNNQGMRLALEQGFDYLLLLNNDTRVERSFLTELVQLMESDPRIGVVGPKVLDFNQPPGVDTVGGDLNLWIARHVHFRRPYPEVRTGLTFINGCAFLLRRQAVEQVGLLDEDYYAYWEEGDYCLRLRRAGWRIACDPRSVIYHKGGQTNRYLSNLYIYYMVRNGFLCMKKNGRWYQWPSFTFCFLASSVAKYSVYLLLKRPREVGVVAEALGDFLQGRLGRKDFAPLPAGS